MSVNLTLHKESLLSAWRSVCDENGPRNWAVFGYDGNSNTLNVVNTGGGGLRELAEELNNGKILYGFLRLKDSSGLSKKVFINWQGEGVPSTVKGVCANHVRAVQDFFRGAHVTINARTEEDIDELAILDKVSKTGGANFVGTAAKTNNGHSSPERTAPPKKSLTNEAEVLVQNRDEFWMQEEREEELRKKTEIRRKKDERIQLEKERRSREARDNVRREEMVIARQQSISAQREYEKNLSEHGRGKEKEKWENQQAELEKDEEERRLRSAALTYERRSEAAHLIGGSTRNKLAIFEEKARRSSLDEGTQSPPTKNSPRSSNRAVQQVPSSKTCDSDAPPVEPAIPHPVNSAPPEPRVVDPPREQPQTTLDEPESNGDEWESEPVHDIGPACPPTPKSNGSALRARALYDYQAADDTEITFHVDDPISEIDQIDPGWWIGSGPDGRRGMFPANYVQLGS